MLLLRERASPAVRRLWGTQVIALPRSRCRFKWFRLASVPAPERLAALRLQTLGWQPFESNAYALILQGSDGLAIAWDQARARDELAAAGFVAERCRLVPETLLREPVDVGVRLVQCSEGVEGQVWRAGALAASRWWAALPSEADWQLFLHAGAATPEEMARPLPQLAQESTLAAKPWVALHDIDASADARAAGLETRVLAVGALALLVGVGAVARQEWEVVRQMQQRRNDMAALRESAAVAIKSRDQALLKAERVRKFAAVLNEPLPIEVLTHVNDMLGKSGVLLKEFELNGSRLRLGLQLGPQTSRAGLVRDLQAGNWFQDVAEERQGSLGYTTLKMTLNGLRPRSGAALAAANAPADAPAPSAMPTDGATVSRPAEQAPMATAAPAAASPAAVVAPTPRPAPPPAQPKPLAVPSSMASGPVPDKLPQSMFDSIGTSK